MHASDSSPIESRSARWRAMWRFLLATLVLAVLYLAMEEAWRWGGTQLSYLGVMVNDPAETYAKPAAALAEQSKARETQLGAQYPRMVFALGVQYGYVSDLLLSNPNLPEEQIRVLSRRLFDRDPQDIYTHAQLLGLGTVEPLTATDVPDLTRRLEADVGGLGARVEQVTSPRLRHLFMLGVHAGTELSRLEPPYEVAWPVWADLVGKHGTLAGVPESLWRPLTRVALIGDPLQHYRVAVDALDLNLANITSSSSSPPLPQR